MLKGFSCKIDEQALKWCQQFASAANEHSKSAVLLIFSFLPVFRHLCKNSLAVSEILQQRFLENASHQEMTGVYSQHVKPFRFCSGCRREVAASTIEQSTRQIVEAIMSAQGTR